MAPLQRNTMRQRLACGVVSLFLLVILSPLVPAADSTISADTTWSGEMVLSGNITVASGTTLTIAPGTNVDAREYSIVVEGTLLVEGASFFSSVPPITQGSHGQGLWPGIVVESGGSLNISNTTVANASAGVLLRGHLSAHNVLFNDAYRALSVVGGSASVDGFEANRMDYEAVYVESGTLNLTSGLANEVAIGLANHGTAIVEDFTVTEAGVGVQALAGSLALQTLNVSNASVGFATVSGASSNLTSFTGDGMPLAIDISDADDFSLFDGNISGERFLLGQGTTDLLVSGVEFHSSSSSEMRAAVDVRCDGQCTLRNSSLHLPTVGVSWSGPGTSVMEDIHVHAGEVGVLASGAGHAAWNNVSVVASIKGVSVQTPTSSLGDLHIELTSNEAVGIAVLGGQHDWADIVVEKPFVSADQSSVGLDAWYSDVSLSEFTSRNLSTGMHLEDSNIAARVVEANIGQNVGVHLKDSNYIGEDLTTLAQDKGALIEGSSTLQLASWTAQLHNTPLMISTESVATIRDFSPLNTAPSSADALGDGTLYYGSAYNPTISTSASYRFVETAVTFTDLAGQPIEASVAVHGFDLMSNENGALTLPLLETGSEVDATLDGAGVRVVLYGGQGGQSVQVPVIPAGDWTISSGQDVVLGSRPDGQPHQLSGDLTVANNGALSLLSTSVVLSEGHSVLLQGSGQLSGTNSVVITEQLQASGESLLTGTEDGLLTVQANVQWGCLSPRSATMLEIHGNLVVQPGCEIDITRGAVQGAVIAQTGAEFTGLSALEIVVLDKGEPVQGALISVDGAVATTDENGQVSTETIARRVTDTGETWGGRKTVTLQRNNFSDFVMWDANNSLSHTFMASTVPSGTVSNWVVLERQWSPYTLDADLLLDSTATMTIQDGVSLRVSEGVEITVNGVLDAGAATLSSTGFGARWAGLALGASAAAAIELTGTQIVEATPALTVDGSGSVQADDVFMARSASDPLLVVQNGNNAELVMRNSRLQNGSGCAHLYPSDALITFNNVSFADCEQQGVWAQQVPLQFTGIALEEGMEWGMELTGVSGVIADVDAMMFSGSGAIFSVNNLPSGFQLLDVQGKVSGEGGIVGEGNEDMVMQHIELHGAPGIDLDRTSGIFSDIVLTGEGSGTAFVAHHGRSFDSLVVERLNISGYSVGISLHSDPGEISAPLVVRDAHVVVSTALATEHYPVRMESSNLIGNVDLSATTVSAVDGQAGTISASDGGEYSAYRTVSLDARRGGVPVEANFHVHYDDSMLASIAATGTTVDVELLLRRVVEDGELVIGEWLVEASVVGSPLATLTVENPASAPALLLIQVQTNQAPDVQLTEPYAGQRVMEGDALRASAVFSDDMDSEEELTLAWRVYDMQGNVVLQGGDEPVYNITDLTAGFYVIEVEVTDSYGAQATSTMDFEYTLLDTDGDWSSTCSSDTWFDPNTGKSCGPNIYDEDDDNDGFSDGKDAFPLDPCAQIDTDGDTQPDVLDCPEGYTSWLTEDMDDDGDGTPDVLEGVETGGEGVNTNALLVVLALLIVAGGLFFARLRRGGPGDLTSLNKEHL